ncbi:MAG: hypothetical protein MK132_23455 [Lentisphaerales bacterium]|nr:hypothetical protein [Lentisphaerales bacterium]
MADYKSGRDFLQSKKEKDNDDISRSTFFGALKADRRLEFTKDISGTFNRELNSVMENFGTDYLSDFPELADCQVFSGDGHYIDHACHTSKDSSGKNYAAGTLYI